MAQKIHVVLEDDIDGGEATETVNFGFDGTSYEIDLNDQNAGSLRDVLASYVGHARKVAGSRSVGRKTSSSCAATSGTPAREIHDWAKSNGHEVPERA